VIVLARIVLRLLADLAGLVGLWLAPRRSVEAENLFLRRQLALYQERGIKARRVDSATRVSLALLSRLFGWRDAMVVVRLETLIRWHRAGWCLFWRIKSRPGRPPIPLELRQLIRRIATENPLWGEERIANELLLKLGLRVSLRTVLKSPPHSPKANAICERVIGTVRRECLDWLIPLSESHLRSILREWAGRTPAHGARVGVIG
jgi:putative transposase